MKNVVNDSYCLIVAWNLAILAASQIAFASVSRPIHCEMSFSEQSEPVSRASAVQHSQNSQKFDNVVTQQTVDQELINYKILLYRILKLQQTQMASSASVAALTSEASRRKSNLITAGVSTGQLMLSAADLKKIKLLSQSQLPQVQEVNDQGEVQTDSLVSELTTLHIQKSKILNPGFLGIGAFEFSSDEKYYLVSGKSWNDGYELKLYGTQTDTKEKTLLTNYSNAIAPKFSPNGKYVAMSSASEFKTWVSSTYSDGISLNYESPIISFSYSYDSSALLIATADGSIRVLDAPTGAMKQTLHLKEGELVTAFFSTNGDQVMTISTEGILNSYTLDTGQVSKTIDMRNDLPQKFQFSSVPQFSRNGRYLALTVLGSGRILVYDLNAEKLMTNFTVSLPVVNHLAFDSTERYLAAAGTDNKVWIFDLETEKQVHKLEQPGLLISQLSFSEAGSFLVSSSDGQSVVWKFEISKEFNTLKSSKK